MTVLLVSIDRTSLSLTPLVLSGTNDANPLGLTAFQAPGKVARITYMPDNPHVHGSAPIGFRYQEGVISFVAVPDVADEAAARTQILALEAALGQFAYTVTTTEGNAPAQVWTARPGTVEPQGRTYGDLKQSNPAYSVSIPVYPVAS